MLRPSKCIALVAGNRTGRDEQCTIPTACSTHAIPVLHAADKHTRPHAPYVKHNSRYPCRSLTHATSCSIRKAFTRAHTLCMCMCMCMYLCILHVMLHT
eukprot:7377123-Prymnesium_polylepis.2